MSEVAFDVVWCIEMCERMCELFPGEDAAGKRWKRILRRPGLRADQLINACQAATMRDFKRGLIRL